MGGGGLAPSFNSDQVDGSGAVVTCEFMGDLSASDCCFVLGLNHICDYE
jgi:hypothetical protein